MSQKATDQPFLSLTLSGDVATKSPRTRRAIQRRLRRNVGDTLARNGLGGRVHDRWDRIDIEGIDAADAAPLCRIFGIQTVRPVQSRPWKELDDIIDAGTALYAGRVAGRRFAVRPRRVGQRKRIPVSSNELAHRLGARLVEAGGRVDLDHPEITVHVEVRPRDALFFHETWPGPGGLPIGVEGKALAMISGGFDSTVAAWYMLGRGVELDFLLFNLGGWPQERAAREVLEVLDRRWMGGTNANLYIVDFRPVVAELRKRVHGRYWQVLLKRLMMRAADRVAAACNGEALVTGEAMGQVSSQTLSNMAAITASATMPVLRPLVGSNKHDIVERARRIGTAEISAGVEEFCALQGGRPVTRTTAAELDREEARIGRELPETLAEHHRVVPHTAFGDAGGDTPELDHVPEHAVVVDLRSEEEYEQWAWPGAVHFEFDHAIEHAGRLPRDRAYLCYCEVGLKSAYLAEMMREAGFEAYSFRGGVPRLRQYARRAEARARLCA